MAPDMDSQPDVERIIDGWRAQILDLTRRNKLIDYTETKTKSLPLVGTSPLDLADILIDEGQLSIRKRRETPSDNEDSPSQTTIVADREPDVAAESLSDIKHHHRQYLRERGVDTLFLTLGRLRWTMEDVDSNELESPLFLVPVSIRRRPANGREHHDYVIHYRGGHLRINPALRRKLHEEMEIDLPDDVSVQLDDLDSGFAVMSELADNFHKWSITREISLDIFDFANVSLYEDIERNRGEISDDPLIRAIAGDTEELLAFRDETDETAQSVIEDSQGGSSDGTNRAPNGGETSSVLSPDNPSHNLTPTNMHVDQTCTIDEIGNRVLEADPAQERAIKAAMDGQSFVLQGPPGTGKSQTIANIIAEKLGHGERVLFVSEKQAALDVVKNRLDGIGLGRFCLEIHGRYATKTSVLDELESELYSDSITPPENIERTQNKHRKVQSTLDSYFNLLTSSPDGFVVTPYEALGVVAALNESPAVDSEITEPLSCDQESVNHAIDRLSELATYTDSIRNFESHPWKNTTIDVWRVDTRNRIKSNLDSQIKLLKSLQESADQFETRFGVTLEHPLEIDEIRRTIKLLTTAPLEDWPSELHRPEFYGNASSLRRLANAQIEIQQIEETLLSRYDRSLFDEDGDSLYSALSRYGWFRFIRPSYHSIKRTITSHADESYHPSFSDLLRDVRDLRKLQSLRAVVDDIDINRDIIHHFDTGSGVDWSLLLGLLDWLNALADRDNVQLSAIGHSVSDNDVETLRSLDDKFGRIGNDLSEVRNQFREWMAVDDIIITGNPFEEASVEALIDYLKWLRQNIDRLQGWIQFQRRRQEVSETLAGDYLENFLEAGHDPELLADGFKREFYRAWLNALYEQTPLSGFNADEFELHVEEYRRLDQALMEQARCAVQYRLTKERPDLEAASTTTPEMFALKREVKKQRNRRTLRELFADASTAIQQVKPCFMMSPRSVAQSLPHGEIDFDVVIFDEASQIPPAKAVSAIIRAEQVIIAGDSNQLPPTRFFETDIGQDPKVRADLENILDEASAVLPDRRLTWHYRSQAPELIAFSNERYYDGRLRTFPAADPLEGSGFTFEYIEDAVYHRGGSRTNPIEAKRVVDIIESHAEESPEMSMGVVAFSRAQEQEIRKALSDRQSENPVLDEFVTGDDIQEEFFIKSLEVVQGDERDRIVFSVGYGPDEDGNVTLNFGPLNESGGERRLNVAITRARQQVTVVTSIQPEDIDLSKSSSRGVMDFKSYLSYVRDYCTDSTGSTSSRLANAEPRRESELVSDVFESLVSAGFDVERRLGGSGYSLDMAIRHPDESNAFILGIECDGSAHQNSESTRERDHLREIVLGDRGWNIHRVWSPDWAADPSAGLTEIESRVAELLGKPQDKPAHSS